MTVRMQESEAAADFSRFLAHLKAGDQVQLESNGNPVGVISFDGVCEERPGQIDYILRKLHELQEQHGPLTVADGYTEHMRRAHDDFNQPWEPRNAWA